MENALLIGLSRQTVLERQLDVVANNIANVNTTGYKADSSLFEEYLTPGAHEDNFVGSDRRISYVQDRGTFRDFAQGPLEQTKNPLDVAIDGSAFLAVQTPGGERYTRDGGLQLNNQGQLVTVAGNPVLGTSGPIVFQPTDHDINITPDGTVTVVEGNGTTDSIRGKLRLVSFADAQKLLKEGLNLYTAGEGGSPQPDTKSDGPPGLHREVQRQRRCRDEPHDRGHARLHANLDAAAAAERPAQDRDPATRRRSGLTAIQETDPCKLFIPRRPEWRPRNLTFRSSPTTSRTCAPPATRSRPPPSRI